VCIANRQLRVKFRANLTPASPLHRPAGIFARPEDPYLFFAAIVAPQQENYATIAHYLGIELRYMDAGE
jgi:hypothetical protein